VGTRGAVYVEFLIAFMPLFVFFMALAQLAYVEVANIVVKHAAVTAARAAIVVLPDDPAEYEGEEEMKAQGKRLQAIELAAKLPLMALDAMPDAQVRFPSTPGGTDSRVAFWRDDLVRVQVEFHYPCRVPIGKTIVCGLFANKKLLGEAALPNQGADYAY
jgi:hypothetical protein